jgi:type III secretory pathway component EscV
VEYFHLASVLESNAQKDIGITETAYFVRFIDKSFRALVSFLSFFAPEFVHVEGV